MSQLPSFAGDVVLDVRVHPALGDHACLGVIIRRKYILVSFETFDGL